MKSEFPKILKVLASLRVTVTLLLLAMLLVYAGTAAQKEAGIWDVQHRFFHSFIAWMNFKYLLPLSNWWWNQVPGGIPIPGGFTLIILLLLNLLAAHSIRFKFNRNRIGVLLIHAGLILLLCGEIVTSLAAHEGRMVIDKGATVSFTQDIRECELAVIDPSKPDRDVVTVIPGSVLMHGGLIQHPSLPFAIRIDKFYANSDLVPPIDLKRGVKPEMTATAGIGTTFAVLPAARANGTSVEVDFPSVYVTPIADGKPLDTYLLSTIELDPAFPPVNAPQEVKVGDQARTIQLRWKRTYKPYSITLLDFTHELYTGTNLDKDFASRIQLHDPARGVEREVRVWMNHPLRYGGETFYQSGYEPDDSGTILQVVRNPGWLIPYISCSMVALGMIVHFLPRLITFLNRRAAQPVYEGVKKPPNKAAPAPPVVAGGGMLWPAIVACACCVYLFSAARPMKQIGEYNLDAFENLPISHEGRVMPLDSLARNSLRIISGRDTLFVEDPAKLTWFHKMFSLPAGDSYPACYWLLDVMTAPEKAADYRVFRIDHPGVLDLLQLDPNRTRFSVAEIMKKGEAFDRDYKQAFLTRKAKQPIDLYQKKLLELGDHLVLYQQLHDVGQMLLAPPMNRGEDWRTMVDAYQAYESGKEKEPNRGVIAIAAMATSREAAQPAQFNQAAVDYLSWLRGRMPELMDRTSFETIFNRTEPFYNAIGMYVFAFLLICASWLIFPATLQRTALWVLIVTLMFHSLGLIARIYMQGRPPVTNLYSSAIFIAWGAAVMCLGLELVFKNGIGTLLASVIGSLSLLVAHNLADMGNGDTMEMLRAVLDTNIWLATHVVIVTFGYAATFLAGFIAIVYVVSGVLTTALRGDAGKTLAKMMYGIICFAMLFSFVGTILGGIWADQSWGRFWGWDPKENGAVLIVLWNAIILHARWAGIVRERGMALLAIAGNIVTSWSWFGTNMLGIGLHSYGFMESAAMWLMVFIFVQIAFIVLGSTPIAFWRSCSVRPQPRFAARKTLPFT